MPRSSPEHVAALRQQVIDRAGGRCEWVICPWCDGTGLDVHYGWPYHSGEPCGYCDDGTVDRCPEPGQEMAHLRGRGMGGSAEADTIDNCAWLCKPHHDLLDGRRQARGIPGRRRRLGDALRRAVT